MRLMRLVRERGPATLFIWGTFGLATAGTIAYGAFIAAGRPPALDDVMNIGVYHGVLLLAALTCFLKAAVTQRLRVAWAAFGVGLVSWAAGDIYWTIELADRPNAPYPSLADAGYLFTLPCFFVGIAMLTRFRVGRFTLANWADGVIVALASAAVAVAVLAPALIGATKGDPATVFTNLAYPLGDAILIAFVAGAVVVSGVRGSAPLLLIGLGLVIWTGADIFYLYQEATTGYQAGWLDIYWLLGALALGLGACVSLRNSPRPMDAPHSPIWLPTTAALVAATILVWDHFSTSPTATVWLAGGTLATVAIRLSMSFRENSRLLDALHEETVTDGLTGLGNRRRLLSDLQVALLQPHRAYLLALFDLDGFKSYNDTFGHLAGDALLSKLGANLAETVKGHGTAYRPGGDEFCILVRVDEDAPATLLEDARRALSARGEGFAIGASCGTAKLGVEGTTSTEALRLVDERMYVDKAGRSDRVTHQTQDLLLRILREREPGLSEHVEGVARSAVAMARALGLDAEELDVLRRASQFHDIGKIAIPSEILDKRGPLDANEWDLMRRHTLIGERILSAAPALRPVADLVRSSHERWDGGGYPDGKAGADIPLGSRIIFLCDSFDAMTSDRPYKRGMPEEDALTEIEWNAGGQFDPELVARFIEMRRGSELETPRQPAAS